MVLWEMRNPTLAPYDTVDDFEVGVEVVAGRRPRIPEDYPDTLQKIMQACWHQKPEKRPSFQYIAALLTKETYNS